MKLAAAAFAASLILAASSAEARTHRVEPGPSAQADLQAALSAARPGDVIRLDDGRYDLTAGLTLDVDRVTIRGAGEDETILSFSGQARGAEGLLITSDGVELRDFAVEDARGDAIVARDCQGIMVQDVRAEWTRGPNPQNGAHGISAVNCANVLFRGAIARGAAGAGLHVSQSRNVIVRDSFAERNVAGIAIENTWNADVFANLAAHNAAGVVVADLPGLAQKDGHSVRVFENRILENDSANFAPADTLAGGIPAGTGVLIVAGRNIHVFKNEIGGNGSANAFIAAYRGAIEDRDYNPLPRDIVIRDNELGRSGFAPAGDLAALAGVAAPDVLWDGATTYIAGGMPRTEVVRIVMRDNEKAGGGIGSFLSLGVPVAGSDYSEAQPDPGFPPLVEIAEPEEVEIDD